MIFEAHIFEDQPFCNNDCESLLVNKMKKGRNIVMKKSNILDWVILIYGILMLVLLIVRQVYPSLFAGLDSNLIFAFMIFGFTLLTIIKNRLRGLDTKVFIQQILLVLILMIAVIAITRVQLR